MAGFQIRKIGVIGGGAWGLTLANLLVSNGYRCVVWDRNPQRIKRLRDTRRDDERLPGITLSPHMEFTERMEDLADADVLLIVVKSAAVADVMQRLKGIMQPSRIVSAVKGFVGEDVKTVSRYVSQDFPGTSYAVLSGPSIALEVARGVPTSVVVASSDRSFAETVQRVFSNKTFRVYVQDDVLGVELGGALKNVIALAAGISDGLGFGMNAKGALLTRGLYEITRFAVALGARRETFYGLAGLGDLITTSFSRSSRNRHVGERLGKGERLEDILKGMKMVAEGVRTAFLVRDKSLEMGIDMPITQAVCDIMEGRISPMEALKRLMGRPLKEEFLTF